MFDVLLRQIAITIVLHSFRWVVRCCDTLRDVAAGRLSKKAQLVAMFQEILPGADHTSSFTSWHFLDISEIIPFCARMTVTTCLGVDDGGAGDMAEKVWMLGCASVVTATK